MGEKFDWVKARIMPTPEEVLFARVFARYEDLQKEYVHAHPLDFYSGLEEHFGLFEGEVREFLTRTTTTEQLIENIIALHNAQQQ